MGENPNPFADPKFYRIVVLSTALGFGCLAAFLFSLRDMRKDVTFVFSSTTVLAFAVGAVLGWAFWAFVRRKVTQDK